MVLRAQLLFQSETYTECVRFRIATWFFQFRFSKSPWWRQLAYKPWACRGIPNWVKLGGPGQCRRTACGPVRRHDRYQQKRDRRRTPKWEQCHRTLTRVAWRTRLREHAMRTVPYNIPYGSILTGTEFREALAKNAQDLKIKRALKSANKKLPTKKFQKKLHPSQDVPRSKSRILGRDFFDFKQILIFCFVFVFV